jgi:hypothetical protein
VDFAFDTDESIKQYGRFLGHQLSVMGEEISHQAMRIATVELTVPTDELFTDKLGGSLVAIAALCTEKRRGGRLRHQHEVDGDNVLGRVATVMGDQEGGDILAIMPTTKLSINHHQGFTDEWPCMPVTSAAALIPKLMNVRSCCRLGSQDDNSEKDE